MNDLTIQNRIMNTPEERKQVVLETIADLLSRSVGSIQPRMKLLDELEMDTLDAEELAIGLEEEFDLDPDVKSSDRWETVQDVIDYVESRCA